MTKNLPEHARPRVGWNDKQPVPKKSTEKQRNKRLKSISNEGGKAYADRIISGVYKRYGGRIDPNYDNF